MLKYALVDIATNLVTNVIMWDGISPYTPDSSLLLVSLDGPDIVDKDWRYDTTTQTFTPGITTNLEE